jgi:L-serine dehydratase
MLRLTGDDPATVEIETVRDRIREIRQMRKLTPSGDRTIAFDSGRDRLLHRRRSLLAHPTGMTLTAYADGEVLPQRCAALLRAVRAGGGRRRDRPVPAHRRERHPNQ